MTADAKMILYEKRERREGDDEGRPAIGMMTLK
jgi:hypothetical protein